MCKVMGLSRSTELFVGEADQPSLNTPEAVKECVAACGDTEACDMSTGRCVTLMRQFRRTEAALPTNTEGNPNPNPTEGSTSGGHGSDTSIMTTTNMQQDERPSLWRILAVLFMALAVGLFVLAASRFRESRTRVGGESGFELVSSYDSPGEDDSDDQQLCEVGHGPEQTMVHMDEDDAMVPTKNVVFE